MQVGRAVLILAGGLCLPAAGFAQKQFKAGPLPKAAPKQLPLKGKQGKQQMAPLPAPQLQRLMQMTPEQRERVLSRLTPERRQLVEQRLNQFQRQFERLPPEQQAALQERYQRFSRLPQERRTAIRLELQELRSMTPAQRAERLNSEDEKQRFSGDELGILRGVAGVGEP